MSPSSGKASGKTEAVDAALRFIGRLAEGDLAKGLIAAQKRIAELEAELAAYRSELGRSMKGENEQRVRAETAEAEVERLRHLGEAPPGVSPSPHCWRCDPYYPHGCKCECHARVNPSGDTLGGGGRESGDQGPGSVPGRPGRPAAANPAARKERLSRHDSAATAMLAILATPEQWAEFQRVARGVNPSGDTLGRKECDEG